MTIYLLILIFSGIIIALLGAMVYLRNPKSAVSRYFLCLSLSILVWMISNYVIDHASSLMVSLLAAHIAPAAAFNTLFWGIIFSHSFAVSKQRTSLYRLYVALGWVVGTVFSYSNLVYNSVSPGKNIVNVGTGPGYILYLLLLVVLLCVLVASMVQAKQQASPLHRAQLNFMLWGIALTFGLAIVNNGIVPLFMADWPGVKATPILCVIFVGSISYAIIRHRLFDIRFVVARTVAYTLLVTLLLTAYTAAVFAITTLIFRNHVAEVQAVIFAGLAIFVSVTFQPLKTALEKITDRIFFRQHYDTDVVLHGLTKIMATTLGIHGLTNKTLDLLISQVHVARGAFFVQTSKGLQMPANRNMQISKNQTLELLNLVDANGQLLIFDELPDGEVKSLMRQLNTSVAAALIASGKIHGLLVLGEKQSGEIYTEQDIKLLQILTPELAVAVDNSLNFEQISQFNEVLEHEVDQATKELRTANRQLERKNRQLEQLDRLKDDFISVTSHELRTPLTAIRGYLWMAMHGKNKDTRFQQYMDRAYTSTEWLISIVNDTLDIARMESGRMELQPQSTNVVELAETAVTELASKATERRQKVIIQKPDNLPLAFCDQAKIHQVIVNLLGNAQKFTPEAGQVTISFAKQKDQVTITVADTGIGISQEDQQKLFQKFSRLETSATTPGTGLGLYLCKQIVELSHGKIWVDSQPGKGSNFHVSLPMSDGSPERSTPSHPAAVSEIKIPT